jgi:hypothetical protein
VHQGLVPSVGALRTDADSDYRPSNRIRPKNTFGDPDDNETSGDEAEANYESDESWIDDQLVPVTE